MSLLSIQVGKFYRRRDGVVRGPAVRNEDYSNADYPWRVARELYRSDGHFLAPTSLGQPLHPADLRQEVPAPC